MLEVLVADDDDAVRQSVAEALESAGHHVTEARDGAQAMRLIGSRVFDVAVCDVHMPNVGGMTVLRRLRRDAPGTAVILMTAFGSVPDAVESLRDGAVDYVTKPFDPYEFTSTVVEPIAQRQRLRKSFEIARARVVARATGEPIVADSPAMRAVLDRIEVIAGTDVSVLVAGDRGVGKELVARVIHAQGARRWGPLLIVDCALLSEALQAHDGDSFEFDEALGGTLVLDGVERLSIPAQARLVRALVEPSAQPRRGADQCPRGLRLITLTREKLDERLAAGALLESLYYRLNGVRIQVPALRQRTADLCALVAQLMEELEPPGTTRPQVLPAAWEALEAYDYPGNVRELRWILEHALAVSEGGPIDAEHLPPEVRSPSVTHVTDR
jgi:DNA-binding NtrC family response regulator